MADSSRIRYALDKSINLGDIKSGNMAIDPNGAYVIRVLNTTQNYFFEAEIIYGKLVSLKSFSANANITKVNFAITTNNFLRYSYNTVSLEAISPDIYDVFVEYNLNPVTLLQSSDSIPRGTIPTGTITAFPINRTYYLEKVHFAQSTDEINASNISVDTLNISNFKTDLSELKVTENASVSVPKLVVQTVGIEQMDVDKVTAKDIATKTIYLSSGNSRGWVFSVDSDDNSNIITLSAVE